MSYKSKIAIFSYILVHSNPPAPSEKWLRIFSRCFLHKRARWLYNTVHKNSAEKYNLLSTGCTSVTDDRRTTDGIAMPIAERNATFG